MYKNLAKVALVALSLAVSFSAVPAHADLVQFASFLNLSQNNFKYDNATGSLFSTANGSTPGAIPILLVFSEATEYGAANTPISATMTFSAIGTGPTTGSPTLDLPLSSVNMVITANTAGALGSNLLTITSSGGDVLGTNTSNQTTVRGDTALGTPVNFSSDYLDFSNTSQRVFSFTTTNNTPPFTVGPNGKPNDFTGSYSGNFSSNPTPNVIRAIPEGDTGLLVGLAMPLVGGLVIARRRRK